jgi:hypothetical protein
MALTRPHFTGFAGFGIGVKDAGRPQPDQHLNRVSGQRMGNVGGVVPGVQHHQRRESPRESLPVASRSSSRSVICSVHARRNVERRSRVLTAARLAGVQLRRRRDDVAAATVLELRDDLPLLTSGRVTDELAKLRASWVPDRGNPTVNEADRLIASFTDR